MVLQFNNLLNSGSKNMNVDGSSVNKVFSYSPGNGNSTQIIGLSCTLRDEGTTSLNKFGAITALTNGLLIQATVSGVTTTIATIKDNADLSNIFHYNQYGNSSVLSLLGIVTPQGFGNSNNVFVGHFDIELKQSILLTDTDSISVTIQDNLSGIDTLQVTCKGLMV